MRRFLLMASLVLVAATSVLAQGAASTPAKVPASFDLTANHIVGAHRRIASARQETTGFLPANRL